MAYPLIFVGLILLVVGARDQIPCFTSTLKADFTGSTNFVYWIAAIFAVGAIGVIKPLKGFSDAFLVLIVLVLVLQNGKNGLFNQLQSQL